MAVAEGLPDERRECKTGPCLFERLSNTLWTRHAENSCWQTRKEAGKKEKVTENSTFVLRLLKAVDEFHDWWVILWSRRAGFSTFPLLYKGPRSPTQAQKTNSERVFTSKSRESTQNKCCVSQNTIGRCTRGCCTTIPDDRSNDAHDANDAKLFSVKQLIAAAISFFAFCASPVENVCRYLLQNWTDNRTKYFGLYTPLTHYC